MNSHFVTNLKSDFFFEDSNVKYYSTTKQIRGKTTQVSPKNVEKWRTSKRIVGQPTFQTHPHLLREGEIVPGIQLPELQERRTKLMNSVQQYSKETRPDVKNHLVIIPSSTKKYMSDKIPYVFRQNSDFLYLTGCLEQDSILVLQKLESDKNFKTFMFVRPKDKKSEMWDGVRTGPEAAAEHFGLNEAFPVDKFPVFIAKFKEKSSHFIWFDEKNCDQPDLSPKIKGPSSSPEKFESPTKFVHTLRWIKSPAEIELMRKTCLIASNSINHTMGISKPGISEHQLFATVDYQCRMDGASFLAYPPVVASGRNGNTIHYIDNTQIVADGDLVLMDAGN